jgi:hypothetical protein
MSQQPVAVQSGYRWSFRGVGMTCAAIWFLLWGAMALIPGLAIPGIIMALLALIAGLGLLLGF